MTIDNAIEVKGLIKDFQLFKNKTDKLITYLFPLNYFNRAHSKRILNDINFDIARGDSVGILGLNGAGKSTLLKIITGVMVPTSGQIKVNGKIAALLELGSGFNLELTGYQNIFFQAATMGISAKQIKKSISEIIEFADIGDYLHQPVKTYSSGMFARLAFSIAINVDPDILIVDEALSVGDAFFQAKCLLKIKELKTKKKLTLLFVSHSSFTVKNMCNKAIFLDSGKMRDYGDVAVVSEKYFKHYSTIYSNSESTNSSSEGNLSSYGRISNDKARFISVATFNSQGDICTSFNYDEVISLQADIILKVDIPQNLSFGFHIRSSDGIDVAYYSTGNQEKNMSQFKKGEKLRITNNFKANLMRGEYIIVLVLSKLENDLSASSAEFYDYVPLASTFSVNERSENPIYGFIGLEVMSNYERI